jgi:Winged helix-turn helix
MRGRCNVSPRSSSARPACSTTQREVWHILRRELDWSWQRPARPATERNDEAMHQRVKKRWPQLEKGQAPGRVDRL